MTPTDVEQIAREAIGLMVEYRDRYGRTEEDATAAAICDVCEGWQAREDARSEAAAVLGASTSAAKAAASRANGRKGGRPRK